MSTAADTACILVAAGRGDRLGDARPKAFAEVGAAPLLEHALRAIAGSPVVRGLVMVVPDGYEQRVVRLEREVTGGDRFDTVAAVPGGPTRQASVERGLAALPPTYGVVLIHDAARCLAPPAIYDAVARAVADGRDAVVPGLPVVDTLKEVDDDGRVVATPQRARLRSIQTPQGFRREVLVRAHSTSASGATDAPDDAALVERLGVTVHVVPGHPDAFKVTHPNDLVLAEAVLARMRRGAAPAS